MVSPSPSATWSPPLLGSLKVISDACFAKESIVATSAAICRDATGTWRGGITKSFYADSALEAELRGSLNALSWCIEEK